jgi:nitrogen fixation protein FixH
MQTVTAQSNKGPRNSDKYIPWYFVAFFAALFVWDGIFVYTATSTHTGVVEEGTYNRGLNYNATVDAAELQDALNWKSSLDFSNAGVLSFSLKDDKGEMIKGATVSAQFFRPTQAGHDFNLGLNEAQSGHYASLIRTTPGQWEVRIFVQWKQHRYQVTERIIVPQP